MEVKLVISALDGLIYNTRSYSRTLQKHTHDAHCIADAFSYAREGRVTRACFTQYHNDCM